MNILESASHVSNTFHYNIEKRHTAKHYSYVDLFPCDRVYTHPFNLFNGNLLNESSFRIMQGIAGFKSNAWVNSNHLESIGRKKPKSKGVCDNKIISQSKADKTKLLTWYNTDQLQGIYNDIEKRDIIVTRLNNSNGFKGLEELFPSAITDFSIEWILASCFRSLESFCSHLIKSTIIYLPSLFNMDENKSVAITDVSGWLICNEFGLTKPWKVTTSKLWKYLQENTEPFTTKERHRIVNDMIKTSVVISEQVLNGEIKNLRNMVAIAA